MRCVHDMYVHMVRCAWYVCMYDMYASMICVHSWYVGMHDLYGGMDVRMHVCDYDSGHVVILKNFIPILLE